MKRPNFSRFGPAMPIVSIRDMTHLSLSEGEWAAAWTLCGPTADANLNGRRALPLWKVITAAYLEGIHHGSSVQAEISARASVLPSAEGKEPREETPALPPSNPTWEDPIL